MADVKRALDRLTMARDLVAGVSRALHRAGVRPMRAQLVEALDQLYHLREALAALTAEPELPEGFSLRMCRRTALGPVDSCSYETALYSPRKAWVLIRPDGTMEHKNVTPAELHAVLAHHIAREAGK